MGCREGLIPALTHLPVMVTTKLGCLHLFFKAPIMLCTSNVYLWGVYQLLENVIMWTFTYKMPVLSVLIYSLTT